jgi:hypothetical protein
MIRLPSPRDRLVCCILSRDEPELLEENIRHHIAEGVDGFVVCSHVTIRENKEVLDRHAPHILGHLTKPEPLPYPQDQWRTEMARLAYEHSARWVIPTDTDEFWHGLNYLDRVPDQVQSVVCYNIWEHLMCSSVLDGRPVGRREAPYYRRQPKRFPKVIHRAYPKMVIRNKSHKASKSGPSLLEHPIIQRHYPVRSWKRFRLKVNTGEPVTVQTENGTYYSRRYRWRALQELGKLRDHWESWILQPDEAARLLRAGELHYWAPE